MTRGIHLKSWLHKIIVAAFCCCFLLVNVGQAEEDGSCQTSKCHADMGQKKWVHGPAAAGECRMCHVEKGNHKYFKLADKNEKLCYNCHEELPLDAHVHPPVEDGECLECHDPHESDYKYVLREKGSALCLQCHDDSLVESKYPHRPVKKGECIACHNPHSAPNEKLLRKEQQALCFSCHDEIKKILKTKPFVHDAADDGCIDDCHNPHGSSKRFLLKTKTNLRTICLECHDELENIPAAPYLHKPVVAKKECANCHNPHGADFEPLLKHEPMDLCLRCHNKAVKTRDGTVLTNMKKLLEENKYHHGPVRKKDCGKCHNPHGSKNFRLLRAYYPKSFYIYDSFKAKNFALCFKCHEKDKFFSAKTTTLTDFRNGDLNLHYLHVNRERKGRTCRACHETHASSHEKHIRDRVPFGKWMLPTNFKLTMTGGGCRPGCHKAKNYDRVNPVKY